MAKKENLNSPVVVQAASSADHGRLQNPLLLSARASNCRPLMGTVTAQNPTSACGVLRGQILRLTIVCRQYSKMQRRRRIAVRVIVIMFTHVASVTTNCRVPIPATGCPLARRRSPVRRRPSSHGLTSGRDLRSEPSALVSLGGRRRPSRIDRICVEPDCAARSLPSTARGDARVAGRRVSAQPHGLRYCVLRAISRVAEAAVTSEAKSGRSSLISPRALLMPDTPVYSRLNSCASDAKLPGLCQCEAAKGARMAKSVEDRGRGARMARRDEAAYCR